MNNLCESIRAKAGVGKSIVFVSGDFNILHPGHLRLLRFASECGDYLVVGINSENKPTHLLPASMRLESISSVKVVDEALILPGTSVDFIMELKPEFVIKGKEHQHCFNPENRVVSEYGGKLVFGSGETTLSSFDLVHNELNIERGIPLNFPAKYIKRRNISSSMHLLNLLDAIEGMKVLVIGDLILDEYISCDPIGMSQEDPTIVVTPIQSEIYIGGAAIVASHAAGMGAKVTYIGIIGNDINAKIVKDKISETKITKICLFNDSTRPTTHKIRYRAHQKTLLRVNQLKQHSISEEICEAIFNEIVTRKESLDLVVFSDFNYGCLPQHLVDRICNFCKDKGIKFVADSQSSSQLGDVSRFKGALLLTPTEREARIAVNDYQSGLPVIAEKLIKKAECENLWITLGEEGVMLHCYDAEGVLQTDVIPAMNLNPLDVSGAGDSLLIMASLCLVNNANVWESAYIGSVAAAIQVSRVGNWPLNFSDFRNVLKL